MQRAFDLGEEALALAIPSRARQATRIKNGMEVPVSQRDDLGPDPLRGILALDSKVRVLLSRLSGVRPYFIVIGCVAGSEGRPGKYREGGDEEWSSRFHEWFCSVRIKPYQQDLGKS